MNLTANQRFLSDKDKINRETTLLDGEFPAAEALKVLAKLFEVKIKFHEEQICKTNSEEDIKMRERKIRDLQRNLAELRDYIKNENGHIKLHSTIQVI
jgi:hypothetical protein